MLADASYGTETAFRECLHELGLTCVVGVAAQVKVWPPGQWHTVQWREGSNFTLRSRFAWFRVHAAHRNDWRAELRPERWALIEWPEGHQELMKYWLSTLPQYMPYPRITGLAESQRTQRHVPSCITSLRLRIAAALLRTLPRYPCCLRANARLRV